MTPLQTGHQHFDIIIMMPKAKDYAVTNRTYRAAAEDAQRNTSPNISTPKTQKAQRLTFFDLPGEIRNKIYGLILDVDGPSWPLNYIPGCTQVSGQMREEALSYWLHNRHWVINLETAPLSIRTKNWIRRRGDYGGYMERFRIHLPGELRGIWRSCLDFNVKTEEVEVGHDVGSMDLAYKLVLWKLGQLFVEELRQLRERGVLTAETLVSALETLEEVHIRATMEDLEGIFGTC